MFSPWICRYSMGKLMVEVSKWWKNVKFIKVKGPKEVQSPWELTQKICPGGQNLAILKNLPGGCLGDGNTLNWLIHKGTIPGSQVCSIWNHFVGSLGTDSNFSPPLGLLKLWNFLKIVKFASQDLSGFVWVVVCSVDSQRVIARS